jgi:hypothetical protein
MGLVVVAQVSAADAAIDRPARSLLRWDSTSRSLSISRKRDDPPRYASWCERGFYFGFCQPDRSVEWLELRSRLSA